MKISWIPLCSLLLLHTAHADLIAQWENDARAGNEAGPIVANTLGGNVNAAHISRGANGTAVAYANTFAMRKGHSSDLNAAITSNQYLAITVTADTGYALNFTNIFLRLEANNITQGRQAALLSDVTGLTSGDEIWSADLYDGGSGPGQFSTHTINVSGIAELQNTTSVEFRLYHWGSDSEFNATAIGRGFQTNGSDDLVFTGSVELIPEPGTMALLGIGCLALLFRRNTST
jgi:hypothetical protein